MGSRPRCFLSCRGVRIERQDRGDALGAAALERVDHDQLFHQPLVQRRRVALQHEGVAAAHRLVEPDEDLAVGEVARRLRGDRDVELLGHLFGQFGMRATREQHQVLAIVGPVRGHFELPLPSGIDTCQWYVAVARCALPGYQIANKRISSQSSGRRRRRRGLGLAGGLCGGAVRAACCTTQPSMLRCGPADTASAPGGTSSRTTVPAPV